MRVVVRVLVMLGDNSGEVLNVVEVTMVRLCWVRMSSKPAIKVTNDI